MHWTTQQDSALKAISQWHKGGNNTPQVFRMWGYAGTGKTTLAKEIAKGINGNIFFCTYTGKAAHVLRQKGCPEASTIHSLIYNPRDKSKRKLEKLEKELVEAREIIQKNNPGTTSFEKYPAIKNLEEALKGERDNMARPSFTLNTDSLARTADLIIVDECSMVDERMGEDLLSFNTKVLVLGDPAQLPPVKGSGFFMSCPEDFMLTEIHRQAQDNPIIQMATLIRNNQPLPLGQYGNSRVINKPDVDPMEAAHCDQIIVGRNKTRHGTNDRVRDLLGFESSTPQEKDKVVCLRNNHDLGLLNGALYYISDVGGIDEQTITMTIRPHRDIDGGDMLVESHIHHFLGTESSLQWFDKRNAQEFDYGYALTAHKAQGSQWEEVLVFDESACFRQDAARWLYTAVTRAEEKVTVVRV